VSQIGNYLAAKVFAKTPDEDLVAVLIDGSKCGT
jgi:hypothetical protein